jgi:hypothetical protein
MPLPGMDVLNLTASSVRLSNYRALTMAFSALRYDLQAFYSHVSGNLDKEVNSSHPTKSQL